MILLILIGACWYFNDFDVTYDDAVTLCNEKNAHLPIIIDDNSRDKAFRFAVFKAVPEWKFWVHSESIAQNSADNNNTYVYRDRFINMDVDIFIKSYEGAYKVAPTIPSPDDIADFHRKYRTFKTCIYFKYSTHLIL